MQQQCLPMEMPVAPARPEVVTEQAMRALFYGRWARWHRCKRFEDAVADPITRELLALAVAHGAAHSLAGRR